MSAQLKTSLNFHLLSPSTSLSPDVRKLICEVGVTEATEPSALTPDGLINWDCICRLLPDPEENIQYFNTGVEKLGPALKRIEMMMKSLRSDVFIKEYSKYLDWTQCSQLLTDVFVDLQADDDGKSLMALLIVTATLERSLGNVYLMRGSVCPSMLKDLLVTREMKEIFGDIVIQVLRIVIGPPTSLNLRNIAWHGFSAPGEIPQQYMYFLLLLAISLGSILCDNGVRNEDIPHRDYAQFPQMHLIGPAYPDISRICGQATVDDLISDSSFILDNTRSLWNLALTLYKTKKYGHCSALLLPQIEHGLRRIFASVNKCPERLLTAESAVLYTTYDEMLCLMLPDGSENKLMGVLGERTIEMLFDLFIYPSGPRIRDRISHGEAGFSDIPKEIACSVFTLAVSLALRFCSPNVLLLQSNALSELSGFAECYESLFHTIPIIKRQLLQVTDQVFSLQSCVRYTPDLVKRDIEADSKRFCSNSPDLQQLCDRCIKVMTNILSKLSSSQWKPIDIQRYFEPYPDNRSVMTALLHQRFRLTCNRGSTGQESEILNLLLRISSESITIAEQLRGIVHLRQDQLEKKELRSRQRANMTHLLNSLPFMTVSLSLVSILIAFHLYQGETITTWSSDARQVIIRFLKSSLQFCENLHVYSSSDKNKWVESRDLIMNFMDKIEHFSAA